MAEISDTSLKVKNYKCFGEDPQGFDLVYPINLVIGKNNSGKSALLDLVRYATNPTDISQFGHQGRQPEVFLKNIISRLLIESVFPSSTSGGGVPGNSFFEFGMRWLNKPLTVKLNSDRQKQFFSIEPTMEIPANLPQENSFKSSLASQFPNPFLNKMFIRLNAERDIKPQTNDGVVSLLADGTGATNIIQKYLTRHGRDRNLVTEKLRGALNKIFYPDSSFEEIVARERDDSYWEIFLQENNKGLISLSDSGSGLKTIILVLINTILRPAFEGRDLNSYIFAFEELENNLHPALQRRLLLYLQELAQNNGVTFLITTHSNVIIDLFGNSPDAQIIHVKNNNGVATAKRAQTHLENAGILDDLDFRSSDLLQSNGVVWVEGPTDRSYFNKWVELWSEGALREGVHYQCVFYGGKLLSHLSANEPGEVEDAISILRVNKNAIMLMDSDIDTPGGHLNTTKIRLIEELGRNDSTPWVTAGREVENYIPVTALQSIYPEIDFSTKIFGQYQKMADYLETIKVGDGEKFKDSKVLFAQKIIPHLTKESLNEVLDMAEKMNIVCQKIKGWNKLPN